MRKDPIMTRMKVNYEKRQEHFLLRRVPVIIRLDGEAFHTLTKKFNRLFDENFQTAMKQTGMHLCKKIQGAKCAYVQSDEISVLLTDFDRFKTEAWFDYEQSKVESISAGMAASYFSLNFTAGVFDSRARNYPKEEVCNYFHARQLDWIRNSLLIYTHSVYSDKQMKNKNQKDMHEMLFAKGMNWAKLPYSWKNGIFISKEEGEWTESYPIFKLDRDLIDDLLIPKEE